MKGMLMIDNEDQSEMLIKYIEEFNVSNGIIIFLNESVEMCQKCVAIAKSKYKAINFQANSAIDKDVNFISSTPKFFYDFICSSKSKSSILRRLKLLVACNIHRISANGGHTYEALITDIISSCTRIPIVSNSIPMKNISELCKWLNIKTVKRKQSDIQYLGAEIIKYDSIGKNSFKIDHILNNRVVSSISKHRSQSHLIICGTRRSTENTAFYLSKTNSTKAPIDDTFTDPKLAKLISLGIAYHHSGLSFEDKRTIEYLFGKNRLKFVCTNDPDSFKKCNRIICKGTKRFNGQAFQHLDIVAIRKLMSKSSEALVVITDSPRTFDPQKCFNITSRIPEHLDYLIFTEMARNFVYSHNSAYLWCSQTFYHFNNNMQGDEEESKYILKRSWESLLCEQKIVQDPEDPENFTTSKNGKLSFDFSLSMSTINEISKPQNYKDVNANQANLFVVISKATARETKLKVSKSEKLFLNKIASSPSNAVRRFTNSKIDNSWEKCMFLIEIVMAKDSNIKLNMSLIHESQKCLQMAKRITRCLTSIISKFSSGTGYTNVLREACILSGSICGEVWQDTPLVFTQIDGIGVASSKSLWNAGFQDFKSLMNASCGVIEGKVNRRPPFATKLKNRIQTLVPEMDLSHKFVDGDVIIEVSIDTTLINASEVVYLIVCTRGGGNQRNEFWSYEKSVKLKKRFKRQNIASISLLSPLHAGLNVKHDFPITDDLRIDTFAEGWQQERDNLDGAISNQSLQSSTIPSIDEIMTREDDAHLSQKEEPRLSFRKEIENQNIVTSKGPSLNRECNHRCKDKLKCKHECCKSGITRNRRSKQTRTPKLQTNSHPKCSKIKKQPEHLPHKIHDKYEKSRLTQWINQYQNVPSLNNNSQGNGGEDDFPTLETVISVQSSLDVCNDPIEAFKALVNTFKFE